MTVLVRMHAELRYPSPAKAKAAAKAFDAVCWDFCVGLPEVDGAVVRFDRTTDVPSDGLEHFEDAFATLADSATHGCVRLDWRPDAPSKIGSTPSGEVDPWALGLTHLLYPKHGLVVARAERGPKEPAALTELVVGFRRQAKFAKRYDFLHRGYRVVRVSWPDEAKPRRRAACVDFRHVFIGNAAPAFGVVIFDESGREVDRLFAGELMFHELAFSPDGTKLAGAGYKNTKLRGAFSGENAIVWDLATRKATKLPKPGGTIRGLRWVDDATVASETETWATAAK